MSEETFKLIVASSVVTAIAVGHLIFPVALIITIMIAGFTVLSWFVVGWSINRP